MISYYGYSDGSGEYFIIVDSEKCSGCQKCVNQCPKNALHIELLFIDLEDKPVASVKEAFCNKIQYICAQCKPEKNQTPCTLACPNKAIKCLYTTPATV
ncbi:MAG: 4Fe-4S binding protein [Candidatus Bathyarchaeota archaeon]|nr:4Fe-4S binding protein [Candidatus Termiticorpusculum sp.]